MDAAFAVHTTLGPGLLESAYESALVFELLEKGLKIARQVPISIRYKGNDLGEGFRADILVEDKVILELKAIEQVNPVHKKQLLTYLRLSGLRLGLLINFGEVLIKNGVSRVVNNLPE